MVGMLVVLVIIGLVFWFTWGGPGEDGGGMNPQETVEKGKQTHVQTELKTLEQSIQLYRTKNGRYPSDLEELVDANMVPGSAIKGPDGSRYDYNPETGDVQQ